jgi:voltage-gated potassium channel
MKAEERYIDKWYFGDYRGGFSGSRYNELTYITIFIFLVTVALSTEKSISQIFHTLYIPYIYNLIELYFFSDFIGKISNTWSLYNYRSLGLIQSILGTRQLLDAITLFFLATNYYPNDSAPVIGLYLVKVILIIYNSELREILNRLKYIMTANPAKTFFPITLLAIITYVMASLMYIIERKNDASHFGSILRAFWFSFVSVTTIGYGDITPASSLGKTVSGIFALLGIICVTFLTANIIDMNSQYEKRNIIQTKEDNLEDL